MEKKEKSLSYSLQKKNNLNLAYLMSIIFGGKFNSLKNETIYILHLVNAIDLREISSKHISEEGLIYYLLEIIGDDLKFKKNFFYELTGLKSKDTFRKYFNKTIAKLGLEKRKSFTIKESFELLLDWQGDLNFGRVSSFSKKEMKDIFTNNNYDRLFEFIEKNEGIESVDLDDYKTKDKISPKKYKSLLKKSSFELQLKRLDKDFYLNILSVVLFLFFIVKLEKSVESWFFLCFLFLFKVVKEDSDYKNVRNLEIYQENAAEIFKEVQEM